MHEEPRKPSWSDRYVPYGVFTWALGLTLIIIGILANAQTASDNRLDRHEDSGKTTDETVIRLEANQQNMAATLEKIADKLNVQ
jgi:hypothetical protein